MTAGGAHRTLAALLLAVMLMGAGGCESLFVRGEAGSSSDPEIDIGIHF